MDYWYLLLVLALYLFSVDFSESKNSRHQSWNPQTKNCSRHQYWEPHKGCKNCSNVCAGRRSILECNFRCPNWGNIQNNKPKVPQGLPITTEIPGENSNPAYNTAVLSVSLTIVLVFLVLLSLGGYFYCKRRAPNPRPAKSADEALTLHQGNDIRIPLHDTNINESFEHDNTTPEAKQAVIIVDEINQGSTSDKEENAEDVDDLSVEGEVPVSQASSAQSIYELSKEASGDANRVEPDYTNTVFCPHDQGGMRHAQLIMARMPRTELRCFHQPNANDVNEEGRESEGATSSSAELPRLTRVSLHRASGGHQNQFFLQQESPAECLEETSAVQPSREDTTQKYHISAQTNNQPYISERLNELRRPVSQGPLPNGIDTYHHPNVNSMFADAGYEHYDQTSDSNDPPTT